MVGRISFHEISSPLQPPVGGEAGGVSDRVNDFFQTFRHSPASHFLSSGLALLMATEAFYCAGRNIVVLAQGARYHAWHAWESVGHWTLETIHELIKTVACTMSSLPGFLYLTQRVTEGLLTTVVPLAAALGIISMAGTALKETFSLVKTHQCLKKIKDALDQETVRSDDVKRLLNSLKKEVAERKEQVNEWVKKVPEVYKDRAAYFLHRYYVDRHFRQLYGDHGYRFLQEVSTEERLTIDTVSNVRHIQTALKNKERRHWVNIAAAVVGLAAVVLGFALPPVGPLLFVGYTFWLLWVVCSVGERAMSHLEESYFIRERMVSDLLRDNREENQIVASIREVLATQDEMVTLKILVNPVTFTAVKKQICQQLSQEVAKEATKVDAYFMEACKGVIWNRITSVEMMPVPADQGLNTRNAAGESPQSQSSPQNGSSPLPQRHLLWRNLSRLQKIFGSLREV